ncbi:MAG: prepilin-type cleavage/methylation domain-containing protein [Planctomycetota bacterium]|jgi:general secretion pathway protein G
MGNVRKHTRGGWTYVEVCIVIAVLLSLAGIGFPLVVGGIKTSRIGKAVVEVNFLSKEIHQYKKKFFELPVSLDDIGEGNHIDPWGNPYQYLDLAKIKGLGKARKDMSLVPLNTDFDLYSMGPDGKSDPALTSSVSLDDIIRANDGRFIGIAEDY